MVWGRSALGAALFESVKRAGPTRADAVKRMDAAARLLDTAFVIPGTNQRVGLDAIVGVVPVFGDLLATLLSSYIIWEARGLGLPRTVIARMVGNLAINGAVGALPLFGDAFSVFFRANKRNMRIVREHLARHEPELMRTVGRGDEPPTIEAPYAVVKGGNPR